MIQINLLPDVKQEYLRARRTRNLAISVSIIVGLAAGGVVALMTIILLGQFGLERLADNSIDSEYSKLSSNENLSELVTLQNQLDLISSQHESKSVDSRMFGVLQAVNPQSPNDVRFSSVQLDPANLTLTLEGVAANGYPAVEALTKTILNTKFEYKSGEDQMSEPIASQVSLGESNFGEDSDGARVLRFTMIVSYHEQLFVNSAKSVNIVGPTSKIDVTDSRIGVPDSLFTAPIEDEEEGA